MKILFLALLLSFPLHAISSSSSEYWFHLAGDYHTKSQTIVTETQYRIQADGAYSKTLFRGTFKSKNIHLGLSYFDQVSVDYEVRPFIGNELIKKKWSHRLYLEQRLFTNKRGAGRLRYRTQFQFLPSFRGYQESFHEIIGAGFSEWRLGLGYHHHFSILSLALTPSVFMLKNERPKNVLLLSLYKVF